MAAPLESARQRRGGFTLLEFVVVIAILGVLTAVVLNRVTDAREKAYVDAMKADLRRLAMVQENYLADGSTYAADPLTIPGFALSEGVVIDASAATSTGWSATVRHTRTAVSCDLTVGLAAATTGRIACTNDVVAVPVTNAVPTADFSVTPATPTAGQSVTFDASASSDTDGTITSYVWDFAGVAGAGVTATHTFASAGSHTVSLTVTDDAGDTDTWSLIVTVDPAVAATSGYAWGGNANGRLGVGTAVANYDTATAIAGGHTFQAITAGSNHGCALTGAGAAYCWGQDFYGQLGNDAVQSGNLTSPVAVAGGLTFSVIVAGANNTCALSSGVAYCWGYNAGGQNGKGVTGGQDNTPVAVIGGLTFTELVGGAAHMCGLTTAGAAYCWGLGTSGELGRGTTTSSPTPAPVSGVLTFVQLAAGANHACGLTAAGAAYCWGDNGNLQLGQGGTSTADRYSPSPVTGGLTFSSIAAGHNRTCGTTADRSYCWGAAYVGDNTSTQSSTPVAVNNTGGGGLVFTEMALGGATCGLATTGLAYCWGTNRGPSGPVNQWQPVTPVSATRRFAHLWRGGHASSSYGLAATP